MALKKFAAPTRREESAGVKERPSVLYVEDEDVNWEVAEHRLGDRYTLRRARNAEEFFSALRERRPVVILMDIQLGGSDLNGIDITRIIKGKYAGPKPAYAQDFDPSDGTPPVLFVTAYAARYKEEELIQAGGDGLVTKPVDFTVFCFKLARVLARAVVSSGN